MTEFLQAIDLFFVRKTKFVEKTKKQCSLETSETFLVEENFSRAMIVECRVKFVGQCERFFRSKCNWIGASLCKS